MEKNNLEWYVYYHESNGSKIVAWNIFKNWRFNEEVRILLSKKDITKEDFSIILNMKLKYCFWSKTEYEIVLSPWVGRATDVKVDIYDQVALNWDRFVEYVWSFKK